MSFNYSERKYFGDEELDSEISELKAKEVLESCFGMNDADESNAEISCTLLLYKGEDGDYENELNYETLSIRDTKKGNFYLERHGNIVQVDIRFRSNMNPELRLFWDQLQQYGKMLDSAGKETPALMFLVVPDKYSTEYYVTLSSPWIWFLQPESPEKETCNIIRMFFYPENITVNKVPDDIDLVKAEAELNRTYNTILTEN